LPHFGQGWLPTVPLPPQKSHFGPVLMVTEKPPLRGGCAPGAAGADGAFWTGGGGGAAGREGAAPIGFIAQFPQTSESDDSVTVLPQDLQVNS
jgi:hypothetical protein